MEFWVCAIFLWKSDWGLFFYARMVCSICFLARWKFLVKAGGILNLSNYSCKILAWGIWNSKLVQMFFGTHAVHCLFYLVMENSWLINWIAYCFVRHAWCALFDLFCDRKFVLEAVWTLSLCNYSWKLDWRFLWYEHMVCRVCFLARCKVLY